MAFAKEHELHTRRAGRNTGVALTLIGFIVVVFGLTVAKVSATGPIQGYDHVMQPELVDKAQGN